MLSCFAHWETFLQLCFLDARMNKKYTATFNIRDWLLDAMHIIMAWNLEKLHGLFSIYFTYSSLIFAKKMSYTQIKRGNRIRRSEKYQVSDVLVLQTWYWYQKKRNFVLCGNARIYYILCLDLHSVFGNKIKNVVMFV